MKRRSFFGRAVAGAAVVAVAPQVLANIPEITLPRLMPSDINWELIDKLGMLYHLHPTRTISGGTLQDCSELLDSIRTYLTARGYPNGYTDGGDGIVLTRRLAAKFNYDMSSALAMAKYNIDMSGYLDAYRDHWRDVIKDAAEELIELWDTIAVDGKLLLYRAGFTPFYCHPDSFELYAGIIVRYVAPMKLL